MAVAVVGGTQFATKNQTGATSLVMTLPSTPTVGNIMILVAGTAGTNTTATGPTGWTVLDNTTNAAAKCWYRIVQSGDAASYTVTATLARLRTGAIIELSGQDSVTPINKHSNLFQVQNVYTTTAQTPSVLNCFGLAVYNGAGSDTGNTTPSGWSQLAATLAGPIVIQKLTSPTSDTTTAIAPSITWTTATQTGSAILILIAPSVGPVIFVAPSLDFFERKPFWHRRYNPNGFAVSSGLFPTGPAPMLPPPPMLDIQRNINWRYNQTATSIIQQFQVQLQVLLAATDALTISDSTTRTATLARGLSDSVSLTDALTRLILTARSLSDSVTLSDAVARLAVTVRGVVDSLSITDSVSRGPMISVRGLTDAVTISDALSRVVQIARASTDMISITDAVARTLTAPRTATDTLGTLTDTLARVGLANRTITDTVTLTDTVARFVTRIVALADSLVLSDSATAQRLGNLIAVALTDTLGTLTDTVTRGLTISRAPADTVTLSETLARIQSVVRGPQDTVSLTDTANRTVLVNRAIADALAQFTDALARITVQVVLPQDTISILDAAMRSVQLGRSATDTVTLSDTSSTGAIHITLTDFLTIYDTVAAVSYKAATNLLNAVYSVDGVVVNAPLARPATVTAQQPAKDVTVKPNTTTSGPSQPPDARLY